MWEILSDVLNHPKHRSLHATIVIYSNSPPKTQMIMVSRLYLNQSICSVDPGQQRIANQVLPSNKQFLIFVVLRSQHRQNRTDFIMVTMLNTFKPPASIWHNHCRPPRFDQRLLHKKGVWSVYYMVNPLTNRRFFVSRCWQLAASLALKESFHPSSWASSVICWTFSDQHSAE